MTISKHDVQPRFAEKRGDGGNRMSNLPKGWEEVRLQEIVKVRKGKKPNVLQESES